MSIILSLAGDGISDDCLARQGYRQVARISGKEVVRIFGTRKSRLRRRLSLRAQQQEWHHAGASNVQTAVKGQPYKTWSSDRTKTTRQALTSHRISFNSAAIRAWAFQAGTKWYSGTTSRNVVSRPESVSS